MSKGSKRRPPAISQEELAERWEGIDWSKGRPPARERKPTVGEILAKDYALPSDWKRPHSNRLTII